MNATRFRVTGRVQGVGYRAFALGAATRLGLGGSVRNMPDGSVESIVCGQPDAIEAYAAALAEGPRYGSVTSVERHEISLEDDPPMSFRIM